MDYHKHCKTCNTAKYASDFPKDRSKKDGYHSQCKQCQKERAQNKRDLPGSSYVKGGNLKSAYGISLDQYNLMRKMQNYCCPPLRSQ